jgi:hypothetical protein
LALTTAFIASGLLFSAFYRPPARSQVAASVDRDKLLAALVDLERDHTTGHVGPETYRRTRKRLLDMLARTLTRF